VHSLGGIVVKQALSKSQESDEISARNIFQSIGGIVFLGTPHQHLSVKSLRNLLDSSAEYTGSRNYTGFDLPRMLSSFNDIQKRFDDLLKREDLHIRIASFFEELPLVGLGQVIPSLQYTIYV
jgi:hypothetical protein